MKKKIAILGSTGSIGKSTIDILKKNKNEFDLVLLTTNRNYKELYTQAKIFNVKNLIITNNKSFNLFRKKFKNKRFKVFNNFSCLNRIFKKKIDYSMSAISGLDGLEPTLKIIKFSKKIAVANKEAIICGWSLIKKALKKNNTEFLPVDSEHFSIWSLIKNHQNELIDKVYLTASGGPFLNFPFNKLKKVLPKNAIKHPNWSMGKKISIDSATMMNKVFEVIETQRIFDLPKSKIHILIHEKSYVHAIVQFKNGLNKILAHDTSMKIPIFNTIYDNKKFIKTKDLDIRNLNNLNLKIIDKKKFPLIEILKFIPETNSLFETLLVSANDELVNLFLDKKISYINFQKRLKNFIKLKEFRKLRRKKPKNIKEIYALNEYVRLKIKSLCI